MSIRIQFTKERCEKIWSAFKQGEPIPVPENGWDENALLILAGTCLSAAQHHHIASDIVGKHLEHREALYDQMSEDRREAVERCRTLSQLILRGDYDDFYEPTVEFLIANGSVAILRGQSKPPTSE